VFLLERPTITTRYLRILFFFARTFVTVLLCDVVLVAIGLRAWSRATRAGRLTSIASGYQRLAIRLGGVMIKVGQFLSSRVDVLPVEVTAELAGLQDEVPPEPFVAIRRLAEAELGAPLAERFASFEEQPLAAASLGQVHRATLRPSPGSDAPAARVVVKIQRPRIERLIATDLAALRVVGSWVQRYKPIRRRADVPALLEEFARTLYEEIDYLEEGRHAETFAANFRDDPGVRVPRVFASHTTRRVLTLEDVYAIKITDYESITAAGIDRRAVAKRLFTTYLKQIFDDGFFHADPHPGNLFVTPSADGWQLTFVDFGMVGRVAAGVRAGARELVIGLGTRDAARLIRGYQELGVLLPGADLELLARAEARVFERFWGRSMAELRSMDHHEMHKFAAEFRELLYDMPFQVPQNLILAGRCVAILSGMCTGLDPQFNVWEGLMPVAQKLIAEETQSGWDRWLNEALEMVRTLLALPRQIGSLASRIERGELEMRAPDLERRVSRLETAMRKTAGAVVFAALLAGGVQLYLGGARVPAYVLFGGAALDAVYLVWPSRS
jgi:predicted unusual protein kinase regulating ubiquinone biosynthesis (AarF/ABC1/UbiB family)